MDTVFILFLGLYGLGILILYKTIMLERSVNSKNSGKYDPFITISKFGTQLLFGGASFVALDVVNKYLVNLQQFNSSIIIIFLMAILNAVVNFIKHV